MNEPADRFPTSVEDEIYRGYELEDIARVAAMHHPEEGAPGFLTDYFGIRTNINRGPWLSYRSGHVVATPPFPDDSFLAEGIEYAGLAIALEQAPNPGPFTFVEIGAGWGPWTALVPNLAARRGFSPITSIGIEADRKRFHELQSHLFENGLLPSPHSTEGARGDICIKLVHGAGWWRPESLFFPKDASVDDAGLAISKEAEAGNDYRGQEFAYEKVNAVDIHQLAEGYGVIDFVHIDIQGAEWELISNSIDLLNKKVRFMFLGTHNRKIEGDLIELLMNNNWRLFREKPCRFYGMLDSTSLTALTYKDGAQFWRNMDVV